jgi:hypothetical protein
MEHLKFFEEFDSAYHRLDGFLLEGKGVPYSVKCVVNEIANGKNNININYSDFKVDKLSIDLNHLKNKKPEAFVQIKSIDSITKKIILANIKITTDLLDLHQGKINRIITHEILHLFELYQRIQVDDSGKEWKTSNTLITIRNKYISNESLYDFIMVLYLSFDQEINARVAETYTVLIESRNKDKIFLIDTLKNSNAYDCYEKLNNYTPNLKDTDYPLFIQFLNELNDTNISNNHDVDIILESYVKTFKKKAKIFKNKMLKMISEVITDINNINEKYG